MNDNAPDSERWVPVSSGAVQEFRAALATAKAALVNARARREAEAVIAKHFPARVAEGASKKSQQHNR